MKHRWYWAVAVECFRNPVAASERKSRFDGRAVMLDSAAGTAGPIPANAAPAIQRITLEDQRRRSTPAIESHVNKGNVGGSTDEL